VIDDCGIFRCYAVVFSIFVGVLETEWEFIISFCKVWRRICLPLFSLPYFASPLSCSVLKDLPYFTSLSDNVLYIKLVVA
jgi:hypothetical protein